jgi:uncharacterized protein (TIGR03083 family)
MTPDERDLMTLAYEERCDLAAFLASLTPKEWQAKSLCENWTVKDVVAHVVSYEELSSFAVARRFAQGLFVRANEIGVREFASLSPDELLNFLRAHLRPKGLTAAFGGMIGLIDGTVHHQDIRRALGYPRAVPIERLERILPLVPGNPRLGARRRIKGLRLAASDVTWQHGDGPDVTGAGEALLMAMTGRSAALDELSGAGKPTLVARITAQAGQRPSP